MEENKKEYSVIGTVTIGTDEYRDLLTEKFEAEKARDEEHDRWYKAYMDKNKAVEEAKQLTEERDKLREELDKLKKFIKKNSATISEDSITVFASLFGEE